MPELPEVEVTRRQIEKVLLGRRVRRVDTTPPSYFFLTRPAELKTRLVGRRFVALERIGKYLLATLDDGSRLLLHLGMTGQLFAAGSSSPRLLSARTRRTLNEGAQASFEPDLHTHLVLHLSGSGPAIYFRDVRKFGKVAWIAPGKEHPRLNELGPDALIASGSDLFLATRSRGTPIKSTLLDQGVLAGVGNIYADEALFLARVHPLRAARSLTRPECDAIMAAVKRVMKRSIKTGGSSISDYVRPDGSDGGYQSERRVYARTGEPCKRCRTPIERIVVGQRSTHFCPQCQR
ncbi:MAG: bifunctional DNA-formamidopyrimidine glycosylase/DNA-(apurinic or apyrimidinic site) lyase [Myxococcota bacterium]